ncbi:MAG: aminopeptidase [Deltaproteobacteria bacterium]|nr:aminopeptidase [Deltaproteobacteria bacterium]
MIDPRMARLAEVLVNYSCKVQAGERVLIEAFDLPEDFIILLVNEVLRAGATPFVEIRQNRVMRSLYNAASEEWMKEWGDIELYRMKKMNAYIGLRGSHNISELSDIDQEKLNIANKFYSKPVHSEQRVKHTKWVVTRWPTPGMAQQANMSTEAFENFYFKVCTLDYAKMSRAMDPLAQLMDRTDRVLITGPGTNLSFSIKDIPCRKCDGLRNIPDGEVYTAPVKHSVNGTIQYNAPTIFQGSSFNNIQLEFKDGRVVRATAGTAAETTRLNQILDSDEGARYVGEFAFGFNPHITQPMRDILFDEKIAGSIHFTPGQAYEQADNGNRSQIHWDMVLIQTELYGGGEIHFDGALIRKNGLFVLPELTGLNPDQLI